MRSPATTLLGGFLCQLLLRNVQGSEDVFAQVFRKAQVRLEEVGRAMMPVPEDTVKEALYHLGTYYIPLDSESALCQNHSGILFESYLNFETWALRMVDASSKLPSGMIDGRLRDLGAYDQCLSVEAPGGLFRGQHCIVETEGILPDMDQFNPKDRQFLPVLRMDLAFSLCVPSSCTPEDIRAHMDVALDPINASAILTPYSCSSTLPEPFTPIEWFAILVLVVIAGLLISSTIYENMNNDSEKHPVLTSFSLSSNLTKMLDTRSSNAAITSLNGLRVLTMAWIVMGHRLILMLTFPNSRFKTIVERIDEVTLAPFKSAQISVEVFFLMTGLLVSYSYLRYRQKSKRPFNLFYFYIFRYLRLTPAFAMMVLLCSSIMIRVTNGPLWRRTFGFARDYCQRNWWANLLYLHNYLTPYELCMTHSWYLASDFQLYLFSPLLLIPLHKRPRLGLGLTAGFFALTNVAGFYNAYSKGLKSGGPFTLDRRTDDNHAEDYIVTHVRASSFILGIGFGYLLFQIKQGLLTIKLSKLTQLAGWLLSIFFILFSIYSVMWFQSSDYVYRPVLDSLYLVFHRLVFTLGIAWIILVCTLGYGGPVDRFLSWAVFVPLARITYCSFLVHLLVQTLQSFNERDNVTLTFNQLNYHFCGDFMASYIIGAVLYLAVEAPFTNLVNVLLQERNKEKSEELPDVTTELPVLQHPLPN